MAKLKYDISNNNFDHFFFKDASLMNERQKELLPKGLLFKVFKKGHKVNSTSTCKLSFLEKIYVLIKALNKRVIILVEDVNGMDEEQYFEYKKLTKKRQFNEENTEGIIESSVFLLANKEL